MQLKIPPLFTNKYFIAFLAVMVWLLFFDKNNMIQHARMHKQLNELRRDKQYYQKEIVRDSLVIKEFLENPEALERYAREEYLMKKEGEDIFIIPD